MEMTAESIIKRYDKLKAARSGWESVWEDIARYVVPSKVGFISDAESGDTNTEVMYDSTAVHSSHLLAASMHSAMTSPSMVWFTLRFRDEELNKLDAAKEWLEDCAERMDAEINQSSFNSEVNELYQDLVDFGTACQLVEMDEDGKLRVQTQHLAGVMISEDKDGIVDTVIRQFKWTARQIKQKWGNAELPKIEKALEDNPDREFHVLHCVSPRKSKDVKLDGEVTLPKNRPYAVHYVIREDNMMVEEGGTYEFPFMCPRWSKRSGDAHGYSPSMLALPDVKTLNRAKYLELSAWEKAIDPPMKANELDVLQDVDLRPQGLTMMRDINGIQPMVDATNWQASQLKSEELRQSIRNIYFTDDLRLPERPNATATEVNIRYEEMQRLLGSTFGRLVTEYLDPLVQRVFNLMVRADKFKGIPEELQTGEFDTEIDIEYVSPLARSQRMDEVKAIQQFVDFVFNQAQMNPDAMDIIEFDEANRLVAERMGVPALALAGEDGIDEKRQQRSDQQSEALAQERQQELMVKGGGNGGIAAAG